MRGLGVSVLGVRGDRPKRTVKVVNTGMDSLYGQLLPSMSMLGQELTSAVI